MRKMGALGAFAVLALGLTACGFTPASRPASRTRTAASTRASASVPASPAKMARAVYAYMTAHTKVPVGLPLTIPLPAHYRWLTATVGGYSAGYDVFYYATHRPVPMGTSRNPTAPKMAPVVLQLSGNVPVSPLPAGAVARLDYFWTNLLLGPAPGGHRVGSGDPVPIRLPDGVSAVKYQNWGDTIQWTSGTWTIVVLVGGTPSLGIPTANEVSQLLARTPLPPFTGLAAISVAVGTEPTYVIGMTWMRGQYVYTLSDQQAQLEGPARVFALIRALQWSQP